MHGLRFHAWFGYRGFWEFRLRDGLNAPHQYHPELNY